MRFKKHKKTESLPPHKDTLVIIGNGFDIWQGLITSYSEFQKYYMEHRDEIMKKLRIKKRRFGDEEGKLLSIGDVELIYGDPFHPSELGAEFWSTFEMSLDKLDAEKLNVFFGKERRGLREMEKSIRNADRILREAFCNWISTITIDNKEPNLHFGDNCVFINFNYTDTLLKRFHVDELDEYHIHGRARDRDSIIFGHSTHPQQPEDMLYYFGGRFRGLYFVERILYETDKHVQDNIRFLCAYLARRGVVAEEIKKVYVLGHSMGLPDVEYFQFLVNTTSAQEAVPDIEAEVTPENESPLDELFMRLQYTINHVGYGLEEEAVDLSEKDAVARRYMQEQSARDKEFEKEFLRRMGKGAKKDRGTTGKGQKQRTHDAVWHISYYSEKDKIWVQKLMTEFGCKNFNLYPSINQCLAEKE